MRALLVALALIALSVGLAFAGPIGNDSPGCQFYPNHTVGNGPDQCSSTWSSYLKPFPVPTASSSLIINTTMPGSRTTPLMIGDPSKTTTGLACAPLIISGNVQAGCETFNELTGALGTMTQVNSFGSGTNAHQFPGGGWIAGGKFYLLAVNGQTTTDASASCFNSSGLAGTVHKCLGAQIGSTVGGGVAFTDISAAGSYVRLPIILTSEVSCFSWGDTVSVLPASGFQPYTICGGQMQGGGSPSNPSWNNQAATTFSYVTLHPVYTDLTGTSLAHLYADTMNGSGGIQQTQDVLTTAAASYNSGEQEITASLHDDVVDLLKVTASSAGTGGVSFTLPAAGTWAGGTCTDSKTVSGTITTDVAGFVADFNAGSFSGTGCSTIQNVYQAQVVQNNTSLGDCATPNQCMYIVLKTGNPNSLSGTTSGSGTGTITATNTQYDTVTAGSLHNYFEWPTMRSVGDGRLLVAMVNMVGTGSASDAPVHQNYGINIAVFCTYGPSTGVWTWYDVTCGKDGASLTSSPATSVPYALGAGAGGSCTGFPYCTAVPTEYKDLTTTETVPYFILNATSGNRPAGMAQFTFDYANASRHTVTATDWATQDRLDLAYNAKDGDLDLVYSCGNSSGLQLCFARVDSTTGLTIEQHYIESGFTTTSLPYTDVSLIEKNDGTMVVYASNGGSASGNKTPNCVGASPGACTNKYVSSDNTGASWTASNVYTSSGTGTNGAIWESASDEWGLHITKATIGPSVTSNAGPACNGIPAGCGLVLFDYVP